MSVHTGEKKYACKHCGKIFNTASARKRHENIHDQIKKYPCMFCGKRFVQKNCTKQHENICPKKTEGYGEMDFWPKYNWFIYDNLLGEYKYIYDLIVQD